MAARRRHIAAAADSAVMGDHSPTLGVGPLGEGAAMQQPRMPNQYVALITQELLDPAAVPGDFGFKKRRQQTLGIPWPAWRRANAPACRIACRRGRGRGSPEPLDKVSATANR